MKGYVLALALVLENNDRIDQCGGPVRKIHLQ